MSEHAFTTDDGVRLVYDDVGPRDGVPVVLCHGLTMEGPQFRETAPVLVERGFRVLMPDLRGHGRSAVPAVVSRRNFAFDRFAADQQAMLDDAGIDRAHWVGNSLGGMIGLRLLPSGRLRSLATYGTPYRIGLNGPFLQFWVGLSYVVLRPRLLARMMAFLVSRDRRTQDYVARRILATRPDVVAAIGGTGGRYDMRDLVRNAAVPVLLLDCRRDWLAGWAMGATLRLGHALPGVEVSALAGGHCADLDDPEAFRAALLGFLDRVR
jgi:pimeloyl-ACP methyl ester carboxylesterase